MIYGIFEMEFEYVLTRLHHSTNIFFFLQQMFDWIYPKIHCDTNDNIQIMIV